MYNLQVEKPVFNHSSVDLFGPFLVKRARSLVKRYGVIFTCLSTRAVHLEVVNDLSTDSFIMAYRRFIARRGTISLLRSDCGTNLRGADKELREALEEWNNSDLGSKFLQLGTEWAINMPGASHHGASVILIRSVRKILRHILDQQTVNDQTLNTIMAEAEFILNSRPLHHVSANPDSLRTTFCWSVRCTGTHGGVMRKKWRQAQVLANSYWKRFSREYLNLLSLRSKWMIHRLDLEVNNFVLMQEPNQPRSHWPLARVIAT